MKKIILITFLVLSFAVLLALVLYFSSNSVKEKVDAKIHVIFRSESAQLFEELKEEKTKNEQMIVDIENLNAKLKLLEDKLDNSVTQEEYDLLQEKVFEYSDLCRFLEHNLSPILSYDETLKEFSFLGLNSASGVFLNFYNTITDTTNSYDVLKLSTPYNLPSDLKAGEYEVSYQPYKKFTHIGERFFGFTHSNILDLKIFNEGEYAQTLVFNISEELTEEQETIFSNSIFSGMTTKYIFNFETPTQLKLPLNYFENFEGELVVNGCISLVKNEYKISEFHLIDETFQEKTINFAIEINDCEFSIGSEFFVGPVKLTFNKDFIFNFDNSRLSDTRAEKLLAVHNAGLLALLNSAFISTDIANEVVFNGIVNTNYTKFCDFDKSYFAGTFVAEIFKQPLVIFN